MGTPYLKLESPELGHSDDSGDKSDSAFTLPSEERKAHNVGDNEQTASDKVEALTSLGVANVSTTAIPEDRTQKQTTVSGDKFLSIADILFNNCDKRSKVKTVSNDQICLSGSTLAHGTYDDDKEMPLPTFSAYSRRWEASSPDVLKPNEQTVISGAKVNHLDYTLLQAKQSSGVDALIANLSSESTCEQTESRFSDTTNSSLNDNDEGNQSMSSPDKAGVPESCKKHIDHRLATSATMDDNTTVRSVITGMNVPRISHVPGEHPTWLGQAVWRHMWHAHIAASQPLSAVCLSPYNRETPQAIVYSKTIRCSRPQDILPPRKAPYHPTTSIEQLRVAADVNDSGHSDEIQPLDKDITDSHTKSPDAEVSSPPPPSSRATYQDLVSSRRRRRQRQAYSALQLSTLEGEFKINRYLTSEKREALSQRLSLSENQVKAWFQNRRTKDKKQKSSQRHTLRAKESCTDSSRPAGGQLGTSFQAQPATSGMASALLLPSQTSPQGPTAPGFLWNTPGHRQLVPLGLIRPAYQARSLAPDINSSYAAQASNYLALLQRIL